MLLCIKLKACIPCRDILAQVWREYKFEVPPAPRPTRGSVRRLARRHQEELAGITDRHERIDRLCELNVLDSVARVAETPVIRRAWARGQEVNLHGLIYGLKDGKLRDLDCSLLARDMGPKA